MAGAPASLALRLAPYLEVAAGKMDRAALDQRPLTLGVISDRPERQADWSLQTAQRLLDEGQADRARKVLADAISAHGPTVPLRSAMARTLIQLGQAPEALVLLDQPPLSTWDPAQRQTLRGRALIVLKDWDKAREALATALEKDPRLAEAHYLLGQVYEQGADWQKAAAEYRAFHDLTQSR